MRRQASLSINSFVSVFLLLRHSVPLLCLSLFEVEVRRRLALDLAGVFGCRFLGLGPRRLALGFLGLGLALGFLRPFLLRRSPGALGVGLLVVVVLGLGLGRAARRLDVEVADGACGLGHSLGDGSDSELRRTAAREVDKGQRARAALRHAGAQGRKQAEAGAEPKRRATMAAGVGLG